MYDIQYDKWTCLRSLPVTICSSSVITIKDKYLFSFGGIIKQEGELNVISYIYRLDLKADKAWEEMAVNMPKPLCDIGLANMSDSEILIFGGWNMNSVDRVCKLTNFDDCSKITVEECDESSLPKADFFIVSGTDLGS